MPRVTIYADARGGEPVLDYIMALAKRRAAEAAAIERYVDLLEEHGASLTMPYARMIDRNERLYELRPGAHRIAYAEHNRAYVLLAAWRKTSQKVDGRALNVARRRLRDWRSRGSIP